MTADLAAHVLAPHLLAPPPPHHGDAADGLYAFDRVAPVAPEFGTAERDRFARDGYVAVHAIYDADGVAQVLDALAAVALDHDDRTVFELESWAAADPAAWSGDRLLDGTRTLMRFVQNDARLHEAAHDPRLLAIVSELLGTEPKLFQDMALLKPPGGGREKPWHQDKAYFRVDPQEPVVGVWIALDDATCANGCMHVLPGTHREGPVQHVHGRDWQICDTWVDRGRDTVVALPAGSALFFDGLLHHGTPPNRTDTRRRAVQFHYACAETVETSAQDHERIYGRGTAEALC